jgi:hypothetical protein
MLLCLARVELHGVGGVKHIRCSWVQTPGSCQYEHSVPQKGGAGVSRSAVGSPLRCAGLRFEISNTRSYCGWHSDQYPVCGGTVVSLCRQCNPGEPSRASSEGMSGTQHEVFALTRQLESQLGLQDAVLVRQLASVSQTVEHARQHAGLADASGNRWACHVP